jgi:sirohydrochlorin ferrochelatase
MKALLIVSHGSRRQDSNDEVRRLTARIRENSGPAFDHVECAFLELSCPQLDSAIADLADAEASDITVFPYFLAAGTHVHNDIPQIIEEQKANYPGIHFRILPHLGALQGISTLILKHIYASEPASAQL